MRTRVNNILKSLLVSLIATGLLGSSLIAQAATRHDRQARVLERQLVQAIASGSTAEVSEVMASSSAWIDEVYVWFMHTPPNAYSDDNTGCYEIDILTTWGTWQYMPCFFLAPTLIFALENNIPLYVDYWGTNW